MPNVPPSTLPAVPDPSATAPSLTPADTRTPSAAPSAQPQPTQSASTDAGSNLSSQIADALGSDPPPTPLRAQQLLDAYNALDPSQQQPPTPDQLNQLTQLAHSICNPGPVQSPSPTATPVTGDAGGTTNSGSGTTASNDANNGNGNSASKNSPNYNPNNDPYEQKAINAQKEIQSLQSSGQPVPPQLEGSAQINSDKYGNIFDPVTNRYRAHQNSGDLPPND